MSFGDYDKLFLHSDDRTSQRMLKQMEMYFSGGTILKGVEANYNYSYDVEQNDKSKRMRDVCQGADRMAADQYGDIYTAKLKRFVGRKNVICEVGILKGTGLCVWDTIFPKSQIIGLDLDTTVFLNNYSKLQQLGAFKDVEVNVDDSGFVGEERLNIFGFDQWDMQNSISLLERVLQTKKINVCIDDGDHQIIPQLRTLKAIIPHLGDEFVYFLEDIKSSKMAELKALVQNECEDYIVTCYENIITIEG